MGKGKKYKIMWIVLLTMFTGVLWIPFYLIGNAKRE